MEFSEINNHNTNVEEMRLIMAELKRKLEAIEALAKKEQGRWAGIEDAPIAIQPFKKIMNIIKNN